MSDLGDSGYANEPWLLLPILHAEEGTPEELYTRMHCQARNCVERCFGLLKARWRCLLRHRCLHYAPTTAAEIVNACCVLHNIAIDARLPDPEPLNAHEVVLEMNMEAGDEVAAPDGGPNNLLQIARAVRDQVVDRLWLHRQ